MSIQSHPLTEMSLGSFLSHSVINLAGEGERANWATVFHYEKARVTMQVLGNSNIYKYTTVKNVFADEADQREAPESSELEKDILENADYLI